MAETEKSKEESKGSEGEEGTESSKEKGGGEGKDHQQKKTRLGGAAHFVHKRVKGQPKSTLKKKEGKSLFLPPPPSPTQETSKQQLTSAWNPTPLWDTAQPVAVISSVETLPSTEGATAMKYDDDVTVPSFVVVPQQSSDDVELSLKLARIEVENCRNKRELKDKEIQIKEYEEEIIKLRASMSKSRGGGVQLTHTIQQLEREKEELMTWKEELTKEKKGLEQKLTAENEELKKEKEELLVKNKELVDEMEQEREWLRNEIEDKMAEEKAKMELEKNQLKEELMREKEALERELEETVAKIKQKETTAKVLQEEEAVLKEVEDLRNEVKMRKEDIETLEAQVAEAGDAYKKLEGQLIKQEEEIEAHVNERLREEVDKHMREAVKAKITNQKIDEQKKVFAAHLKEKEDKAKTKYEILLASKERRIKELGAALEEIMEQLKQKEEVEHNLREEITNLQLKLVKQLDILRVEKNQLELNYQEQEKEYVAQIKELEEEMDKKMKQLEETVAKIKQQKEATAEAQEREKEEVLKEVEDLKNKVQTSTQDIETLEARVAEAGDAYKKLEAQLKEQEEEIEAHVNERVREEVDKHLREAMKAKITNQKIDEQKKVFADHLKEKEDKVKARYEILLASKERHIKELGTELEEIMEQLKQKEETERNLRDEITNLQLEIDAGDGASVNNSLGKGGDRGKDDPQKKPGIGGAAHYVPKKKEEEIKHQEDQVFEKEKRVFNEEKSDAADKRERELMIKQVEDLKKESEKNVAEATRRIDELEETYKEQLFRLREENTVLKGTLEEQGNMRERLTELETLFDKVAASHEEEMDHIRGKEETKRVELEEKLKRKFNEESQQRTQSHLKETIEAMELVKKKYKDRLQAREMELQAQLDKFSQENKELKEHLYHREEALERKGTSSMELKEQLDIMKLSAEKDQKIKEISERLALRETENELYKQDFESERKDRERINDQLIKLHEQHKILKQESAEKEKEAHVRFHFLTQSNSTLERDLEESRKEIAIKGAEIESLVQKNAQLEKQHTEEIRKMRKKLKESETGETEKMKEMKEEMQVLTAQVNAYSREVDKQKGLVTQSQEKHKTEIIELNERLSNELKSKKQLDNELTMMRQKLANVSADEEELLRTYNKEQTIVSDLEDKIRNMQQASRTLRDRMSESQKQLSLKQKEITSLQQMLSGFQNSWKLSHREVSLTRQELGRGGWGVVWVGQLRVAVKQLHETIESQHNTDMFRREINTMSQLRHPNLVQFIGAVLDHPSGYPMIVTEVMDTSLRKAYESKELTPDPGCRPVILSIMHDAAEGLNYLHCLPDPIIHRDVSSANVLLQSIGYRKWKGKISDFGSAKLAKKAVTEGPGTFVYSAPEALQSIASQDPTKKQTTKMDVFSYGVLLCEIITCRFPNRDIFQGMLRQVHSISNRPSGTRDTQGYLLHSLIVSCCLDDPSRRPTMEQIIEQLNIISK